MGKCESLSSLYFEILREMWSTFKDSVSSWCHKWLKWLNAFEKIQVKIKKEKSSCGRFIGIIVVNTTRNE